MKFTASLLLSAAAVLFLGACDKHSFDETKVLHAKFQEHGHGAAHDTHAAPAHGEDKAAHGAAAAPNGDEKKSH
jgi:hypothetical protein